MKNILKTSAIGFLDLGWAVTQNCGDGSGADPEGNLASQF